MNEMNPAKTGEPWERVSLEPLWIYSGSAAQEFAEAESALL